MRPARASDVFDAVAHPVRRQILVLLRDGARPAGELAHPFAMSLAAVAQHLAVLREAELVETARRGRNVIYVLNPRPLRELFEWVDPFASFWNAKLDALERHLDANPGDAAAPRASPRPAKRRARARRTR
ncbi:MAG TPA: metalloregulator ArsR/SmtB family transcription factor [Kofleriaceae bacterium]|nr:metalloregulator ArsR/SmtB family transcription factor [Kofleriaceae bacterium]